MTWPSEFTSPGIGGGVGEGEEEGLGVEVGGEDVGVGEGGIGVEVGEGGIGVRVGVGVVWEYRQTPLPLGILAKASPNLFKVLLTNRGPQQPEYPGSVDGLQALKFHQKYLLT